MVQNPTSHLDNRFEKLLGDDYTTKLKAIGINLLFYKEVVERFIFY
jgi:hypothetical protein